MDPVSQDAPADLVGRIRLLSVLIDERLEEIRDLAAQRRDAVIRLRQQGWSQTRIGDECGIGQRRVSAIERSG